MEKNAIVRINAVAGIVVNVPLINPTVLGGVYKKPGHNGFLTCSLCTFPLVPHEITRLDTFRKLL